MTQIGRLTALFQEGTLLPPDADAPNLVDLSRAIGSTGGAGSSPLGPGAARIRDVLGPDGPLVLILVDGLGLDAVSALPAGCFLKRHLRMELRTVFPATTSAALVSLATGSWPGTHGVPTWFLYLEEEALSIRPIPFDERFTRQGLLEKGVPVSRVFPLPSFLSSMAPRSRFHVPEALKGTVFTSYLSGGAVVEGYPDYRTGLKDLSDGLDSPGAPGFHYFYISDLDEMSHDGGKSDVRTVEWLRGFDEALGTFQEGLKGGTRLTVSADHGFADIAPERHFVLKHPDPLLDLLKCPPSGDARVPIFHLRNGRGGEFCGMFQRRFGGHFALLTPGEAEGLGLFGPGLLSGVTRRRLGDFLGVALDGSVLRFENAGEEPNQDRGSHSGLTPAEMRIPLIVAG